MILLKAYFFTCGRENLGLSPGLKLGMMFPWPVRPICSHSAFPETRGAEQNSDARCEFSVLGGRQDISSAQTCGASSSENPSEQGFLGPTATPESRGSHLAARVPAAARVGDGEPVDVLCWVTGNVPPASFPTETAWGCHTCLCSSLKTKP